LGVINIIVHISSFAFFIWFYQGTLVFSTTDEHASGTV